LLVKLGPGPLRVDRSASQQMYYFVDGGVAQMRDNKLTILSPQAMLAGAIDAEAALAAYHAAAGRKTTTEADAAQRELEMSRARAQRAVAGKAR